MAKPRKNKSGLHKSVSSVLEGVSIPQGVRNWRPNDKCDSDRTDDSPADSKSNISSVFKGVPVAPDDDARLPAGKHPQNKCSGVSLAEPPNDHQTLESDRGRKHDYPEESADTDVGAEQSEFVNEVVYYRDPTLEPTRRTLGQWIQDNFFVLWEWLRHFFRRSSTKKG